ncbi:MAG: GNAT family N-acetyltransferase, partial [Bacteroidota bacterium]
DCIIKSFFIVTLSLPRDKILKDRRFRLVLRHLTLLNTTNRNAPFLMISPPALLTKTMLKFLNFSKPTQDDHAELKELFVSTITDTVRNEGEYIQNQEKVIQSGVEEQMMNLKYYFTNNDLVQHYLIAKSDSRIIGTIAYGKPSKLVSINVNSELTGIPEIKSLYILPSFQKRGVGSLLFAEIITELRTRTSHYCLDCGYTKSQNFWKKKLGEPQYILKDYWSEGNDHMIWKLPIDS